MNSSILNDEPTLVDRLERTMLARAFSELVNSCETPLVIGVYGIWGSGKTTFMKLIDEYLDSDNTRSVWFNAWEHEQDEAPAVSLLHATVDSLELGNDFNHSLSQVALAFGSVILQKTTTLSLDNLEKVKNVLDEEAFRVREARTKLRAHFQKVLHTASDNENQRIVFFIDDLDRCAPENVLRMLSAIKLYFNLPSCVFFLGVDYGTIESAINASNLNPAVTREGRYLDKMVQLPFSLPPIGEGTFNQFLAELLPSDLKSCLFLLIAGLDRNPRTAKRFINNLILRHRLAINLDIATYDPRLLALLLLIEHEQPQLFADIARHPERLLQLHKNVDSESSSVVSPGLAEALRQSYVPEFAPLDDYLSLTIFNVVRESEIHEPFDWVPILDEHRVWIRSYRQAGSRAVVQGEDLSGADLSGLLLREVSIIASKLDKANLSRTDLRRAELAGSSFREASLKGANLRYADLREVNFAGADLRNSSLRGTILIRANLRGADLRGATSLTREQLEESLLDENTRLPVQLSATFQQPEDELLSFTGVI